MKFATFLETWHGLQAENKWSRILLVFMAITICVLAIALNNKSQIITLVPPALDKKATVTRNYASTEYKKAWGMYLATLIGNVSPGTVDFISEALGGMLSSDLYNDVYKIVISQAKEIKEQRVAISFTPRLVAYLPNRDLICVTGTTTISGVFGNPTMEARTYEFKIQVQNYMPVITYFSSYKGEVQLKDNEPTQ